MLPIHLLLKARGQIKKKNRNAEEMQGAKLNALEPSDIDKLIAANELARNYCLIGNHF